MRQLAYANILDVSAALRPNFQAAGLPAACLSDIIIVLRVRNLLDFPGSPVNSGVGLCITKMPPHVQEYSNALTRVLPWLMR